MTENTVRDDVVNFVPDESGVVNRLADHYRLLKPISRRILRVAVLVVITWVPLMVLTSLSGHLGGNTVTIALKRDPEIFSRFVIALPLLELSEIVVALSLAVQVRQFLNSKIVPQSERCRFDTALIDVRDAHASGLSEAILFVLAIATSVFIRPNVMEESSWEKHNEFITPAGWWHLVVSLPVLYFFVFRAIWMFVLWTWFLFRVSRLNLELTPTHPDHAGGLGFLGSGLVSFTPTILSFSVVVSAGFAYEIYHRGESLDSLKYHLIIYLILVAIIAHLPVVPFAFRIIRCRIYGLLEFSELILRYDRAFEKKWIHQPQEGNKEELLGTADIQSLADIATAYEHVNDMRMIPFDSKAAMAIAAAAIIPMLPLIGTEIPLQEIIGKLGELLI